MQISNAIDLGTSRKMGRILKVLLALLALVVPVTAAADLVDAPFIAYAETTPVIDGLIGDGEWDDAATATQVVSGGDEAVQELTVSVKHDDQKLYMLVVITNEDYSSPGGGADFVNILFDNDFDGAIEEGEDAWSVRYDGASVVDGYNPTGTPHWMYSDESAGGTHDINAAISHSNPEPYQMGTYVAEFEGLLASGDALHDFTLLPGESLGFAVSMADAEAPRRGAAFGLFP
jgi:hypothetical protein